MTEDIEKPLEIASKLRNEEINTQVYLENKKAKAKFKYADRLQIPYVITIGEDEVQNNVVSLKDMNTGDQKTLTIEEAIKLLKNKFILTICEIKLYFSMYKNILVYKTWTKEKQK